MSARTSNRMVVVIFQFILVSFLATTATADCNDPLEDDLVCGDPMAEAIIDQLRCIDPAATIAVIGKHRETDQATRYAYTLLKVRFGERVLVCCMNETSGAFALDARLIKRERDAFLELLPPVYRKMGMSMLSKVRDAQGGVLGAPTQSNRVMHVTLYADSAEALDAIESALGDAPCERFDAPALYAANPPVVRADDRGVLMDVPPPPQLRAVMTRLTVSRLLQVGPAQAVVRIEPTLMATTRLDQSVSRIGGDVLYEYGLDGYDADIAIVDTGVDDSHPAIVSVIAEMDFANAGRLCVGGPRYDRPCYCPGGTCFGDVCLGGVRSGKPCSCEEGVCEQPTDDSHGHGTHVAGIAASIDDIYRGMAGFADIINAKAFRPTLLGDSAESQELPIAAALEFANGAGADVINASYGFSRCTRPGMCRLPGMCGLPGMCDKVRMCSAPKENFGVFCRENEDCDSRVRGDECVLFPVAVRRDL